MHVSEIWRYPIKSLAGYRIQSVEMSSMGIPHDREIVIFAGPRTITARRYPRLLGLQGSFDPDGGAAVNGHGWQTPEAKRLVEMAVGMPVELTQVAGTERFDVLPLLVATDGAIAYLGIDGRRLRPNIVISGVSGLEERTWPGTRLQIGSAVIAPAQLRGRCVMTTYDPDSQVQDLSVLKKIVSELDGTMALDCSVVSPGVVNVGSSVVLL